MYCQLYSNRMLEAQQGDIVVKLLVVGVNLHIVNLEK